jgi:hypothetical protein
MGALAFKYLLEGEELTPENYVLIVAKNAKKFDMPRHRDYFEQFRYAIEGEPKIGDGIRVKAVGQWLDQLLSCSPGAIRLWRQLRDPHSEATARAYPGRGLDQAEHRRVPV